MIDSSMGADMTQTLGLGQVCRVFSRPVYAHEDHKDELINKLKSQMSAGYPTEVAGEGNPTKSGA
jgi:hypothetical protein